MISSLSPFLFLPLCVYVYVFLYVYLYRCVTARRSRIYVFVHRYLLRIEFPLPRRAPHSPSHFPISNFREKKKDMPFPLSFAEVDTHAPRVLLHPGVPVCDCKREGRGEGSGRSEATEGGRGGSGGGWRRVKGKGFMQKLVLARECAGRAFAYGSN